MAKRTLRTPLIATLLGVAIVALVAIPMSRSWQDEAAPAAPPRTAPKPKPAPTLKPAPQPAPAPDPAAYTVKRVLKIDGPFRHGDYVWDESGAPAGPIVVTVDLAAQVLSVFRGGYEIGAAVILYGADEKPTPLGVFAVSQKDADHVSNLYNAPMPHMLRLTNDGISIHGSDVRYGSATHGCVGVPKAFARKLFGQVKVGDTVIVTNGETLKLGEAITAA